MLSTVVLLCTVLYPDGGRLGVLRAPAPDAAACQSRADRVPGATAHARWLDLSNVGDRSTYRKLCGPSGVDCAGVSL